MPNRVPMLLVFAWLAACTHSDPTARDRARAFAALPNWTGIWISDVWATTDASGLPPGRVAELTRKWVLKGPLPYNAQWQARNEARQKDPATAAFMANFKVCEFAFPMVMQSPQTFQVVITPEETLLVFENQAARHIYTDGRKHTSPEDVWPTRFGESIGTWHGQTLVVDTIARRAGPLGIMPVDELSGEARFTEHIRLVAPGRLEDVLTVTDPVAFTKPWEVRLTYSQVRGIDRMVNYDCDENDRNPIVNGQLGVANP